MNIKKINNFKEFLNENIFQQINFEKWFGNSKVTYNKKPLIVYHGSSAEEEFKEFDGDIFFTEDYFNAAGYAGGEGIVYDVYISIKNPLIIDAKNKKWDDIETKNGINTTQGIVGLVNRNIYDGVIFINIKDNWIDDVDYQNAATIYVTFNPNQIKSVDNDGTWDINNNNIYS
jgi:hypothetical protein